VLAVPLVARRTEGVLGVLLAAGALLAVGPRPALLGLVWLAAVTPRLIAIDVAEHRLPDRIVLPGLLVGLAEAVSAPVGLVAAAAYGGLLLLLHLVGGMGLGDVKLAPVLALVAAAVEPAAAVAAPLAAFLVGGVVAVGVLVRHGPGTRMAFGPAMLLGAWIAVLLG